MIDGAQTKQFRWSAFFSFCCFFVLMNWAARTLTSQPKRVQPPPSPLQFRPQHRFRELASSRADAAAARGQEEFQAVGAAGGGQKGEGEGLLRESMVCPVFAALPQEQQLEAFEPAPAGTRKFVLVRICGVSLHHIHMCVCLLCSFTCVFQEQFGLGDDEAL